MRTELVAQGFTRTDRKYLVWVDAAVGICGLGEVYGDTRPGPENRNNRGPSYARVDTPCWQYAELHEIFHNLGAVQRDAPHPSAAWHCTDEADVMCYDDDASGPVVMTVVCTPEQEALLDCSDNDYFNTNPAAGNCQPPTGTRPTPASSGRRRPPPAQLGLTGAATITYGDQVTLPSRLTDEQTTTGIEGEQVNLFARRAGSGGELGVGTATAADGAAAFTAVPAATTTYRTSPGSVLPAANGPQVTVSVRPTVTARLRPARSPEPDHHRRGRSPPAPRQRVYLQR
jgi:hypothetical protein